MSNKVLNYAGKRPMSLAFLVMSNLTLCLLFSGLLTPTPSKAQPVPPNPPANNENTNCPNYTTNTVKNCPEIINHGTLDHMTNCVKLGDPLPDPTYTPGTATAGSIVTVITETCANTATASTNPVSYSFKWAYYPPKPTGNLVPGTYTTKAVELCVSSDTNDCSSPSAYTMGTVTWNVVNTRITKKSTSIDLSKIKAVIEGAQAAASVVGGSCKTSVGSFSGSQDIETQDICCAYNATSQQFNVPGKKVTTSVNFNIPVFSQECSSPKFPVLGGAFMLNATEKVDIKGTISGKEISVCGDTSDLCLSASGSLTISGTIGLSVIGISSDYLSANAGFQGSGTISGQYCQKPTGEVGVWVYDPTASSLVGCVKSVDLVGYVTVFGGFKKSVSCNLYKGSCL